ncbi:hypothetical protein P3L10_011009 [Capsicum annuum]
MRMCWFITTLIIVAFFLYPAYAYDLNTLQDMFLVNGKICKDPKLVKADDFFASGLNDPPILDDVLAKGFQLDKKVIEELRKKLS